MQKRASLKLRHYETVFTPLPPWGDASLYFDRTAVVLPYAEDFPVLHYHDRYEVGICEAGEGLFLSEGEYASVSAGDLIFVMPGCRHYSRSLQADALCHCRFVYLHAEALKGVLPDGWEAPTSIPTVIRPSEHPRAAARLSEITELCREAPKYREQLVTLYLATFLLECEQWFPSVRKRAETALAGDGATHAEAAKLAQYLSLHYRENQASKELAALCHLSESQLRRQFSASYGMPPIAYRNALRCSIAAELLRRTTLSIGEISDQLGYATPSDFYRQFQKHRGMSPSEYRKKNAL